MIPTKTLREAALLHHRLPEARHLRHARRARPVRSSTRRCGSRTNDVIDTMASRSARTSSRHRIELIRGAARIAGCGNVHRRDTTRWRASSSTRRRSSSRPGSRPYPSARHPVRRSRRPRCRRRHRDQDSTPAASWSIGGGAIGCEHASIFTALGAQVTLIDRGERLLSYVDAELLASARADLRGHGHDIRLGDGARTR